ncbi:F0F1 ATP synthase subunit B [Candidatus Peregrinibacteria bacterium]|nr:F0F1 ATP synthase subunit B [Candidatus Peregrinibacteria bacterium]
MNFWIKTAKAENLETIALTQAQPEASSRAQSQGLSLDPSIVAFQALNFIVLLFLLNKILYKPLLKLLKDREKKIKEGVENAEKADFLLKESSATRENMLKEARIESQSMIETARKNGEQVRFDLLSKAQDEVTHFIAAGKNALEAEEAKAFEEVKVKAVDLIILSAEKFLKGKIDQDKDAKLIKEYLDIYAKS